MLLMVDTMSCFLEQVSSWAQIILHCVETSIIGKDYDIETKKAPMFISVWPAVK